MGFCPVKMMRKLVHQDPARTDDNRICLWLTNWGDVTERQLITCVGELQQHFGIQRKLVIDGEDGLVEVKRDCRSRRYAATVTHDTDTITFNRVLDDLGA